MVRCSLMILFLSCNLQVGDLYLFIFFFGFKLRFGLDTLVAKQSSHNCGKRVFKKKSMALEEAIDEYTQDGKVDLKGNPVLRSKRGGRKACWFVVGKLYISKIKHWTLDLCFIHNPLLHTFTRPLNFWSYCVCLTCNGSSKLGMPVFFLFSGGKGVGISIYLKS